MKRRLIFLATGVLVLLLLVVGFRAYRRVSPGSVRPEAAAPESPAVTPSAPAVIDPIEDEVRNHDESTALVSEAGEAREIFLADGTFVEVDERTAVTVERIEATDGTWRAEPALAAGAIRLEVPSAQGRRVVVRTPVATMGVRGAETAAARLRESARHAEAATETLGETLAATYIGGTLDPGQDDRLERLLRRWRFEVKTDRRPERRVITIEFLPPDERPGR